MSTVITAALIQQHLLLASLDGAQTTLLGLIGDAAQSMIEQETGRLFASTAYVEGYSANFRDTLYLRQDPIVSVTSVSRSGEALTVGSGAVYPPSQVTWSDSALSLTDGSTFSGYTVVSYNAGWGTVPAGLVRAGVMLAAHLYTAGRFSSQQNKNVPALGDVPKMVIALIQPFKRPWGAS